MVRGLTPENEAFLNEAVTTGQYATREEALNAAILRLRSEQSSPTVLSPQEPPPEEWFARVKAWAESHEGSGHYVDTSRESIYEGRGE